MSVPRPRLPKIRVTALAALPVLALVLVGCGDVREQTQAWREAPYGASATAGSIDIRNAVVVANAETGQATLLASFANRGVEPDALTSVVVAGTPAEPEAGPVELPARGHVSVGPDGTRLDVDGLTTEPGFVVDLEFIFADAPRATAQAIVQSDDGLYAGALEPTP
jgi:hypothetical protein